MTCQAYAMSCRRRRNWICERNSLWFQKAGLQREPYLASSALVPGQVSFERAMEYSPQILDGVRFRDDLPNTRL